jgi:hypothetical protein
MVKGIVKIKILDKPVVIVIFIQIVLFLFFADNAEASIADSTKPVLSAIEVRDNNPVFGQSFYRVFQIAPFVVYQSQYQFDSSGQHAKFDSSGNWDSNEIEFQFSEKRSRFFVFHKDSSFGLSFDPHRSNENNSRLPVDSAILGITGSNTFECLLMMEPDTSIWNSQKTELKEVYVQKPSKDTPAVSLSFFYSSSMNHISVTLNAVLDSARRLKLYKYEYLIREFYSEKLGALVPGMVITTEMKEITVSDPGEIMQYIDRYRNTNVEEKADRKK